MRRLCCAERVALPPSFISTHTHTHTHPSQGVLELGREETAASLSSKDWKSRLFVLRRDPLTRISTLYMFKDTKKKWQRQVCLLLCVCVCVCGWVGGCVCVRVCVFKCVCCVSQELSVVLCPAESVCIRVRGDFLHCVCDRADNAI